MLEACECDIRPSQLGDSILCSFDDLRQRLVTVEEQLPLPSKERDVLWKRRADDERVARQCAQTERRIAEDALQVRPAEANAWPQSGV